MREHYFAGPDPLVGWEINLEDSNQDFLSVQYGIVNYRDNVVADL